MIKELKQERELVDMIHSRWPPALVIFGSARIPSFHPVYKLAEELGRLVYEYGWSIRTGAGPSMMEAPLKGYINARSKKHHKKTFANTTQGIRIKLPFEQETTQYAEDCYNFEHFITRKMALHNNCIGIIAFAGGFGTLDEVFEVWSRGRSLVLVGKDFWQPIIDTLQISLEKAGLLWTVKSWPLVTDKIKEALEYIHINHSEVVCPNKNSLEDAKDEIEMALMQLAGWEPTITFLGEPFEGCEDELITAGNLASLLIKAGKLIRLATENKLLTETLKSVIGKKNRNLLKTTIYVPRNIAAKIDKNSIVLRHISNHHVVLVEQSEALIFLPGGIKTLNRLFDAVVVTQTKKVMPQRKILLVGKNFWQPIRDAIVNATLSYNPPLIAPQDADLLKVIDNPQDAFSFISQQSNQPKNQNISSSSIVIFDASRKTKVNPKDIKSFKDFLLRMEEFYEVTSVILLISNRLFSAFIEEGFHRKYHLLGKTKNYWIYVSRKEEILKPEFLSISYLANLYKEKLIYIKIEEKSKKTYSKEAKIVQENGGFYILCKKNKAIDEKIERVAIVLRRFRHGQTLWELGGLLLSAVSILETEQPGSFFAKNIREILFNMDLIINIGAWLSIEDYLDEKKAEWFVYKLKEFKENLENISSKIKHSNLSIKKKEKIIGYLALAMAKVSCGLDEIEAKKTEEKFSLQEVFEKLKKLFKTQPITYIIDSGIENIILQGRKLSLISALYNLIMNALQNSNQPIKISVKLNRKNKKIIIKIINAGKISSKLLCEKNGRKLIFSLNVTTTKGGTGLGTTESWYTIKDFGGSIDYENIFLDGKWFVECKIKLPFIENSNKSSSSIPLHLTSYDEFLTNVFRIWQLLNKENTTLIKQALEDLKKSGYITAFGRRTDLFDTLANTVLPLVEFSLKSKVADIVGLLAENIAQHANDIGILLLKILEDGIYIAVLDKGEGFFWQEKEVFDIQDKEGHFKQRLYSPGKGVGLKRV
ncbi:MAG: LOG family protein, partial [Candidatus Omnitrophica bacterium]|nr:LOG family protein [Candidatus Omnitrophota bacterium]